MSKLKINITIAERKYPITVDNANEEEVIRKAAKNINDLIYEYEQNYDVADKQDVLAMCALQFASNKEADTLETNEDNTEAIKKLDELTKVVSKVLE